MRGEVWAGGGSGRGPAAAHERHARREGPAVKAGGGYRAGGERTWNISFMVVTFDVSKLSGWLNADASCQVERHNAGRGARCEMRDRRWEGVKWRLNKPACWAGAN